MKTYQLAAMSRYVTVIPPNKRGTGLEDIQLVGLATKSHQKSKLLLSAIESTQQRQSKWKLKL